MEEAKAALTPDMVAGGLKSKSSVAMEGTISWALNVSLKNQTHSMFNIYTCQILDSQVNIIVNYVLQ